MNFKEVSTILVLAFVGWAICGGIMGIGMSTTTMQNTLIIHAILVPVVFVAVSLIYFKNFNYTTHIQTASIFLSFVILMDLFVVSILINGNFDMFKSILGTWIPFAGIFLSTYLTGSFVRDPIGNKELGPSDPVNA